MRVWIDMTASAHVLVFRPLIELMRERGDEVEITAREYAQTLQLLELHGLSAEVIGRHLDVPVVSIPPEQAAGHFTWLGGFIGLDAPASSALTRELLGWQPTQPGLLDDLDKGHYFDKPSA